MFQSGLFIDQYTNIDIFIFEEEATCLENNMCT